MPEAIVPSSLSNYVDDWKMSPGLEHEGFIFLTGFTGMGADGVLSNDPREQIESAFSKVDAILAESGLDFSHIVEMTSYHIGLRDHLAVFREIRERLVREPYPSWTAIEVAGFVREGAVIELRCIAMRR